MGARVLEYTAGSTFGELALMYNAPRAASVVATSDAALWAMERDTFSNIVMQTMSQKREHLQSLLGAVPLLQGLDAYERQALADLFDERTFKAGENCTIALAASATCPPCPPPYLPPIRRRRHRAHCRPCRVHRRHVCRTVNCGRREDRTGGRRRRRLVPHRPWLGRGEQDVVVAWRAAQEDRRHQGGRLLRRARALVRVGGRVSLTLTLA
jgi:hypothetical protein